MDKYVKKYAIVWLTLIVMYHVVIFLCRSRGLAGKIESKLLGWIWRCLACISRSVFVCACSRKI